MEGRPWVKATSKRTRCGVTEFQVTTNTKLTRIAQLSRGDSSKQFNCLMHHFNVESLRGCYQELDGKKALGTDG